jgi:integrase
VSVYRRPGQEEFTYDFVRKGRRFSGPTGATEERHARRVLKDKIKLAEAEMAREAEFLSVGPMKVDIAFSRYWNEVGQHSATAADLFDYLGWLQKQIGPAKRLDEITSNVVADLIARRRGVAIVDKEGNFKRWPANATVNRAVIDPLRAVLFRARDVWDVPVRGINWKKLTLSRPQERVREARPDEEAAIDAAMRDDYAPAVRFALMTGCRRAEIVGLIWPRVDFFSRQFTVIGKGRRGQQKARVIPMTDECHDLLWSLKDHHSEAVFTYVAVKTRRQEGMVRERGRRYPITIEGFKSAWRRYRPDTVEDFRFHDTRHTAATRLLRQTGNLRMPQLLLGHYDVSTTAKYAHVTNEDLRTGMQATADAVSPTKNPTAEGGTGSKKLKNIADRT